MDADPLRPAPACADDVVATRRAVLALVQGLGWTIGDAIAFAEALTGRPWRLLDAQDLEAILDEGLALVRAIEAKRTRRSLTRVDRPVGEDHAVRH